MTTRVCDAVAAERLGRSSNCFRAGAVLVEALAYLAFPGSELWQSLGGFWYLIAPGLEFRAVDGRTVASLLRSGRLRPWTMLMWDEARNMVTSYPATNRWCLPPVQPVKTDHLMRRSQ